MQRDIWFPRAIIDESAGLRWWYSRRDRRYHNDRDSRVEWPSHFFSEFGRLRVGYRAV